MAQWTPGWSVSTAYASLLTWIRDMLLDVAKGNDPAKVTVSNPVTDMIRWSSGSSRWEIYNGSTWGQLATAYAINISGSAASASAAPWSGITGKPTTVSGYGITDAITTGNIATQSVNYAASAGSAGSATNAAQLGGVPAANFARLDAIPLFSGGASGNEGGEIRLAKPPTGSVVTTVLILDIVANLVRIFEGSGSHGAFLDLSECSGFTAKLLHSANIGNYAAPMTALTNAVRVEDVSGNNVIRFTRANGTTFDVVIGAYTGGGGGG